MLSSRAVSLSAVRCSLALTSWGALLSTRAWIDGAATTRKAASSTGCGTMDASTGIGVAFSADSVFTAASISAETSGVSAFSAGCSSMDISASASSCSTSWTWISDSACALSSAAITASPDLPPGAIRDMPSEYSPTETSNSLPSDNV